MISQNSLARDAIGIGFDGLKARSYTDSDLRVALQSTALAQKIGCL